MDVSPEGRTFCERYQVNEFPHISILDPRTGRLIWRKEGWTQQNPVTAESFAEMAMDFCSRNSFERPPQAPRPGGGGGGGHASAQTLKRPPEAMTEDEQVAAAMAASMNDVPISVLDVDGESNDSDVEILDMKPPAKATLFDELLAITLGDEPADGAKLQFRLPDGKRVMRKFNTSDSLKEIYAFLAVRAVYMYFWCTV
jgi:hypothetical protein